MIAFKNDEQNSRKAHLLLQTRVLLAELLDKLLSLLFGLGLCTHQLAWRQRTGDYYASTVELELNLELSPGQTYCSDQQ